MSFSALKLNFKKFKICRSLEVDFDLIGDIKKCFQDRRIPQSSLVFHSLVGRVLFVKAMRNPIGMVLVSCSRYIGDQHRVSARAGLAFLRGV